MAWTHRILANEAEGTESALYRLLSSELEGEPTVSFEQLIGIARAVRWALANPTDDMRRFIGQRHLDAMMPLVEISGRAQAAHMDREVNPDV